MGHRGLTTLEPCEAEGRVLRPRASRPLRPPKTENSSHNVETRDSFISFERNDVNSTKSIKTTVTEDTGSRTEPTDGNILPNVECPCPEFTTNTAITQQKDNGTPPIVTKKSPKKRARRVRRRKKPTNKKRAKFSEGVDNCISHNITNQEENAPEEKTTLHSADECGSQEKTTQERAASTSLERRSVTFSESVEVCVSKNTAPPRTSLGKRFFSRISVALCYAFSAFASKKEERDSDSLMCSSTEEYRPPEKIRGRRPLRKD